MVDNLEKRLFGEQYEDTPETLLFEYVLDFGDAVDEMAGRLGLTHKDIARVAGMKASTFSQVLSGTSNPTVKTLERIALALQCKLEKPRLIPLIVAEAEQHLKEVYETEPILITGKSKAYCDLREQMSFDEKMLGVAR